METEEFWNTYMNSKKLLDVYDTIYEFFSAPLPENFEEEYDVEEIIIETKGHHEGAHLFEKALAFIDLIEEKHPLLHGDLFDALDDLRVNYHCFHGDQTGIGKGLSNFISNPGLAFHATLDKLLKLAFYQYTDLLDASVRKCYDNIKGSQFEFNLFYLQHFIFNLELEKYFQGNRFDPEKFSDSLSPYFDEINAQDINGIQAGLFEEEKNLEELQELFNKDRTECVLLLKYYFMKEMAGRGMCFYLSAHLWNLYFKLWEEKKLPKKGKVNLKHYFRTAPNTYDDFIHGLSGGLMMDNTAEMMAAIWGGVFVYDFLVQRNLIDEKGTEDFYQTNKKIKGRLIAELYYDSWMYSFIHTWGKPDSVDSKEFEQEKAIFKKSHGLTDSQRDIGLAFPDEMAEMGGLSKYILDAERKLKDQFEEMRNDKTFQRLMEAMTTSFDEADAIDDFDEEPTMRRDTPPQRKTEKVGSNEPCPCGSGKKYKKCCGK